MMSDRLVTALCLLLNGGLVTLYLSAIEIAIMKWSIKSAMENHFYNKNIS